MLSLLCHHPQLPSDIDFPPSASTSSLRRASKRAAAASALGLSVGVAGPSKPSDPSGNLGGGLLSRHNTLKKRRHFSLSSGSILRSASRASTASTSRCVSSSNNISAPTDFRHHFHLGVEIVRVSDFFAFASVLLFVLCLKFQTVVAVFIGEKCMNFPFLKISQPSFPLRQTGRDSVSPPV